MDFLLPSDQNILRLVAFYAISRQSLTGALKKYKEKYTLYCVICFEKDFISFPPVTGISPEITGA